MEKITSNYSTRPANAEKLPDARLQKACREFESLFVYFMLKEMDKTVPKEDGLFGENSAQGMFRELMYEELSRNTAARGVGIADILKNQLKNP